MRLIASLFSLVLGAMIFAVPNMGRRDILFAVPVAPGYRAGDAAQRALAAFRWLVAIVTAAGILALFWSAGPVFEVLTIAVPIGILLAGGCSFVRQHRIVSPHAIQPSRGAREADLATSPDRLPPFTWAVAGPFALLGAAALTIGRNWASIPARFPTHWGFDGRPNSWSNRTPHDVYAPLLFGTELCAWLLVMGLACWFGSRRSKWRTTILGVLIAAEYMLALLFALVAVQPLYSLPVWPIACVPLAFIIPIVFMTARQSGKSSEPVDATPNDCWKGGLIYYNPSDAALFVEKRTGVGYTMNFGNRWSWALMLSLAFVIGSVWLV